MFLSQENPLGWLTHGLKFWGEKPGAEEFKEAPGEGPFSDYRDAPFPFDEFYSFFPEFQDSPSWTEAFMSGVAKQAAMFIKPSWCRELDGPDRKYAYFLMVAHMAVLTKQQQVGLVGTATPGYGATAGMDTMPGVMTSASVGGVSVSKTGIMQPRNMYESYFYQTPYGRTFLVFMQQQVAAGMIYSGEENIANCLRD